MSLVYGGSSLLFYPENEDYIFSGVGPYIRVYKNTELVSEFELFSPNSRIKTMIYYNNSLIAGAEDLMCIINFNEDFTKIEKIVKINLPLESSLIQLVGTT